MVIKIGSLWRRLCDGIRVTVVEISEPQPGRFRIKVARESGRMFWLSPDELDRMYVRLADEVPAPLEDEAPETHEQGD